jgi:hypothetical protein
MKVMVYSRLQVLISGIAFLNKEMLSKNAICSVIMLGKGAHNARIFRKQGGKCSKMLGKIDFISTKLDF